MQFVDTHCHIHETQFELAGDSATRALWLRAETRDPDQLIARATAQDVKTMICVGTTADDSRLAIEFVQTRPNCFASIGVHPHEAKFFKSSIPILRELLSVEPADALVAGGGEEGTPATRGVRANKVVAIGECGLDYFYNHSDKPDQQAALRFQVELALEHNLPMIFHVREAFDDFWPIFDDYKGIRGVLHSFTDSRLNLDKALERGLYIGVNGIMTFTKDANQLDVAKAIPLQKLLLETDAPFLTPVPFRGRVNEPAHVRLVADFMAHLRDEPLAELANQTSANAQTLFNLK
jgi:TatD DNase family protein